MNSILLKSTGLALLLTASAGYAAGTKPSDSANPMKTTGDVPRTSTVPATAVPGQPIRPESNEETDVPKTPMDQEAPETADVGANKMAEKPNSQPTRK